MLFFFTKDEAYCHVRAVSGVATDLQQIKMIVVHDGHCCMCQFFLVSFSFYRRFIMNLERMYLGAVDCQEALVTCILELYV